MSRVLKRWLKAGLTVALVAIALLGGTGMYHTPPAAASLLIAGLPAGDAITDGKALLRYSLPIDNESVRKMQEEIEAIATPLRISRRRLTAVNSNLSKVERILSGKRAELLASVPGDRQPQAEALLDQIQDSLQQIHAAVDSQDKEVVWTQRAVVLDRIGQLEALMVTEFPFEVPEAYANLPQLKGRAVIEFTTNKGTILAEVDGYSAPVTAGNFVDLVERGFYDGLEFIRAEDFYILQTGDPPGKADGFIDPKTNEYRAIPLEVLVEGDDSPIYGITLEEAGRYLDQPVLPFSAYGAMAMARPGNDANGGSSQFFFFLFEPELTPAGSNLLDGRYAVFGYVTEGNDVLEKLKQGDRIESAKVIRGGENLVQPAAA